MENSAFVDKDLFEAVIANIDQGVYFVDVERRILFWNHAAESITGYAAEEVVGRFCQSDILCHIDKEGHRLCLTSCPLFQTLGDGATRKALVFLRRKDGKRVPVHVHIVPYYQKGAIVGAIETFTVASRIRYNDELIDNLTRSALFDSLTNLPNRRYLEDFLKYTIEKCRLLQSRACFIFFDINHFKRFNDTFGHDAGDKVLIHIGQVLSKFQDALSLFGRWGGDEFFGVYPFQNDEDALTKANEVLETIEQGDIDGSVNSERFSISLGVTDIRNDDNVEGILNRADHLMYQSKNSRVPIEFDLL